MTGPEHYRKAESILAGSDGRSGEWASNQVSRAQVHATLALAAATAVPRLTTMTEGQWYEWRAVTGADQ